MTSNHLVMNWKCYVKIAWAVWEELYLQIARYLIAIANHKINKLLKKASFDEINVAPETNNSYTDTATMFRLLIYTYISSYFQDH